MERGGERQNAPRCSAPPNPPEPSSPSSLPFPEVRGAGPRALRRGRWRRCRGREEGGGAAGGGGARERRGAGASRARRAERRRRRRAQGQGMTDAPSACAYVRESGRGRERAEPGLPSPSHSPSEAVSLELPASLASSPAAPPPPTPTGSLPPRPPSPAGSGRPEEQVQSPGWWLAGPALEVMRPPWTTWREEKLGTVGWRESPLYPRRSRTLVLPPARLGPSALLKVWKCPGGSKSSKRRSSLCQRTLWDLGGIPSLPWSVWLKVA